MWSKSKKIVKTEGETLWWRAIIRHLDMVAAGHISGQWENPNPRGWKPPRLSKDDRMLPEPHHR